MSGCFKISSRCANMSKSRVRYPKMSCVAGCCSVLQCKTSSEVPQDVMCCSVLQCVAVCCSVKHRVRCPKMSCVAGCCSVLQCKTSSAVPQDVM